MANLKELRDERLRKLVELRKLGVNPYPASTEGSKFAGQSSSELTSEILSDYSKYEGRELWIGGRIQSIRKFGKIAFIVVNNDGGEIQLFFKEENFNDKPDYKNSELSLKELPLLDSTDFIEAKGKIIKTQTGEISVEVKNLRILAKSLRPLPTKQEGFTNKEERLRRRYVDTNVNDDVKKRFIRRSKFWKATRDFLNKKDFIEINTPVLEHTTGGADAKPFKTHMDALDQDFYLRISHELPLKRLVGGGYEKVYDIGPRFRNENYTDEHLPEHVAMEWYWAYADWRDGMKLMEEMFSYVLHETFGDKKFEIGSKTINFDTKWEELDYSEAIRERYGIDVFDCTIDQVRQQLKIHKLEVEKADNKARCIDKLWKNIRKDIVGPTWLINTPTFISPLSKANPKDPNVVQRFQAIAAGSEICNGFSELNDPIEQLKRFLEQQKMREAGDEEAMMLDIDYVEMLEYGMPPTCGLGYSERVFWLFEGVSAREGVPFPQLRVEVDEITKKIYPDLFDGKKNG